MKKKNSAVVSDRHDLAERVASLVVEILEAIGEPAEVTRDELLTLDRTGIERASLIRLIKQGKLPAVRIGRCWHVRTSDLLRLVDMPKVTVEPAQSSPDASYISLVRRTRKAGAA